MPVGSHPQALSGLAAHRVVTSENVARICAVGFQHSDVALERLVNLARDLDKRAFLHAVGPARITFEGQPVETRRDPLVVKDEDLGVGVLEANYAELVVAGSKVGELPQRKIVGSTVVRPISVTDVHFDPGAKKRLLIIAPLSA